MKRIIDTTSTRHSAHLPTLMAQMPRPAPVTLLQRWFVPALLGSVVLTLYLSTLSDVHTFDALTYLRDIEQRSDFFLHPHHLLYGPTGWVMWQSWRLLGYAGDSALPLQVLNAFVAVGCGLGLYHLTHHITRSVWAALITAGIFFFSYANWYFAVEVEVYMLALAWQVVTLVLLVELVTTPKRRSAPCIGLAVGLAALYHQVNGLLVPVVVVGVFLAPLHWRDRLRALVLAGLSAGGIVALGYSIVAIGIKDIHTLGELYHWMFLYVQSGLWAHAKQGRWQDLTAGLSHTISTQGALPYWIGIIALLLLGWTAVRHWPRVVLLCVVWIGVYAAFFVWWEPDNIEFWISTLLPLWLLVGLAAAHVPQRWRGWPLAGAAVLLTMLGWHNYGIVDRRGDATFDPYRPISAAVGNVTTPSDLIIEPAGILELYLPHYERRPNLRMIHRIFWESGNQIDPALNQLRQEVETALNAGVAVLVGRDALDRGDIPPDRLAAFWQPYRSAMQPAVTVEGITHFWRIPSTPEVIAGGGWDWKSFTWGWQGTNIVDSGISDEWCFNPQSDPMLASPRLSIDATSIRGIEVTMATTAQNQTARLYYGGLDGRLTEEHSVSWPVKGDGSPHSYMVPLEEAPGWSGTLTFLRLDPITAGDGTAATRTCITYLRLVR